MKKYLVCLFVCILVCISVSIQASKNTSNDTKQTFPSVETYEKNIQALKKISYKEFYDMYASGKAFRIYIGRPTCPYCRQFSPTLKKANQLMDNQLYYYEVGSTDYDENSQLFIKQTLKIKTVPSVLYIKNAQLIASWSGDKIKPTQLLKQLDYPMQQKQAKKPKKAIQQLKTAQIGGYSLVVAGIVGISFFIFKKRKQFN